MRQSSPLAVKPDSEEQKRVLTSALQTVKSFALYFVVSEPFRVRPRLMNEIANQLQPEKTIQWIEVTRGTTNLLHLLEEQLQSPLPDIVFLFGLENNVSEATPARAQPFLLNLNATRNNLYQVVPRPLVLWTPQFVVTAMTNAAPDFISVRSGVYNFPDDSISSEPSLVPPNDPLRVFLSYSGKDIDFAYTLTTNLMARGVHIITDEYEMGIGDSLTSRVQGQLMSTDIVLLCLSEQFNRSSWASLEFKALPGISNVAKVIGLRLDDTSIPYYVSNVVDFRRDYKDALNTLLQAIYGSSRTSKVPLMFPTINRSALIMVLEDLPPGDLTRIITLINGASRRDRPLLTVSERVASLIGYAESSIGPGLNAIADAIIRLYPDLTDKIRSVGQAPFK